MISKDTEFLKREADEQIAEAKRERLHALVESKRKSDAATLAPDNGRDVTASEQAGRWMSPSKFQKALRELNPSLVFEVAHADQTKTGIYLCDGISNEGTSYHGLKFICGMETGFSPEFSVRLEKNGVMSGEIRGWRTVLATLIKHRLIGKYEAETLFKVHFGKDSKNWKEQVN